ncbi:PrgI family protein [Candidatus Saccharibacteria bacterium]|nr:PrgI family protein [Candidatus Saccharibacteria bacterium]
MAQYKVPQDVEAEDKLIGPFSFRQFVYLLIAGGCIAVTVGLFQLFPLLAILPIPPALLFLVLALPIKKDQPMATYLAAIVSYYLKPRTKKWTPGQRESTILITAPKIVEDVRTRDLSEEEATHRLSFLANVVDTQGYSVKGVTGSSMREDLVAEANATQDMFDVYQTANLNQAIHDDAVERRREAIDNMREAIKRSETANMGNMADYDRELSHGKVLAPESSKKQSSVVDVIPEMPAVSSVPDVTPTADVAAVANTVVVPSAVAEAELEESVVVMPDVNMSQQPERPVQEPEQPVQQPEQPAQEPAQNVETKPLKPAIMELANNNDFSVATIAKEANRINGKEAGEVFVSLH